MGAGIDVARPEMISFDRASDAIPAMPADAPVTIRRDFVETWLWLSSVRFVSKLPL